MKRIAAGAKPHPLLKTRPEPGYRFCPECNGKGCDPCLYTGWGELGPKALERALAEYEARKAKLGSPPSERMKPEPSPTPSPATPTGQLTFGW